MSFQFSDINIKQITKLTTELDGRMTLSLNFTLSGSSLEQEEQ